MPFRKQLSTCSNALQTLPKASGPGKIDVMFTLSLISTRLSHLNIDKLF